MLKIILFRKQVSEVEFAFDMNVVDMNVVDLFAADFVAEELQDDSQVTISCSKRIL